jgi:threonine dehydrogenase-like Zn-dependent dehydrogenase
VDHIFDCNGLYPTAEQAIEMLSIGGTALTVGLPGGNEFCLR